jgi:hypothetical protein
MNQERMRKLSEEQYQPAYAAHMADNEAKAEVVAIVREEEARALTPLQTSRNIRTRTSELLQARLIDQLPNPAGVPTTNLGEMRRQVELHHEHQTAHFHAIWQMVDKMVVAAGHKVVFE